MAASIGTVKLPIVSTFDASGIAQAKAGLRDLEQAGQAVGGGGVGGGAAANPYDKLGVGRAVGAVAGETGLGGLVGAAGAGGLVAGAAMAGIAIYSLSQRAADSAIRLRDNARELHVSTQYYAGLSAAARRAGTDVSTVTSSLSGLHSMAESALTGDVGQAIFLESMGIGRKQLMGGVGDTAALSRLMLAHAQGPQRAALFGSETAARAAEFANGPTSWKAPTSGEARSAAQLKIGFGGIGTWIAAGIKDTLASLGRGTLNIGQIHREQRDAAAAEEEANRVGEQYRIRQQHGASIVGGLLSPYESAGREIRARADYVYSADPAEQTTLSERSRTQVIEGMNASVSAVRSLAENLTASLDIGQRKWDQFALQPKLLPLKLENFEENLRRQQEWNHQGHPLSREQTGEARRMGMDIINYSAAMTQAGPLAGAADMNTVGGYSQLVNAQEGFRQSIDSRAMFEMIIRDLPPAIGNAVRESVNFAYKRPTGPFN
jgi:hypothetical protein